MHLGVETRVVVLSRMWWTFVLRGILAIAFGIVAFLFPAIALVTLQALVAFWLVFDGIAAIGAAWASRGHASWWIHLLEGIGSLLVGLLIVFVPIVTAITTLVLLYLVAFWAIVTGIFEVWMAIRLREQIRGELFMAIGGVLSILFGVYLLVFPGAGIISLLWLVGFFAVLFGLSLVAFGWRLRGIQQHGRGHGGYAGMHP